MRTALAVLIALFLAAPAARSAGTPEGPEVDVALVLLSDVSRSIDNSEFDLQKRGYLAAFADPKVIAAITGGRAGAIAVAYVEFASAGQTRTVVDWTVVRDGAGAQDFAERVAAAPRSFAGRTAIGDGIAAAMQQIDVAGFKAQRQVIDVCGDGTSNAGRPVTAARDAAVAAGITLNGLTIINEHPVAWAFAHTQPPGGLTEWYRQHVIGGPGAFVLEIHDFQSFGEAMARKLVSEIAARPAPPGAAGLQAKRSPIAG
jgi:hypothetical protein